MLITLVAQMDRFFLLRRRIDRGALFTTLYRVRTISAVGRNVDKGQLIFGRGPRNNAPRRYGGAATVNEST